MKTGPARISSYRKGREDTGLSLNHLRLFLLIALRHSRETIEE
jgi:hypothetical protein